MEHARILVWCYASADDAWHAARTARQNAVASGWSDAYIVPIRNRNGLTISYRIVALDFDCERSAYGICGENGIVTLVKEG